MPFECVYVLQQFLRPLQWTWPLPLHAFMVSTVLCPCHMGRDFMASWLCGVRMVFCNLCTYSINDDSCFCPVPSQKICLYCVYEEFYFRLRRETLAPSSTKWLLEWKGLLLMGLLIKDRKLMYFAPKNSRFWEMCGNYIYEPGWLTFTTSKIGY